MCNHASVEILLEKKWSRCAYVASGLIRRSRNITVQTPVVQSRFVQAGGYVNFASSAMLQQSNEITVACSLAANHVGGICFDAIPTSRDEVHTAPPIICHISGIYNL